MNEKQKALLQKLKALAERGVGGEKEGAERKLKQLMAKYGVDQLELEGDQVSRYEIKYRGEFEHRLLSQIVYRARNDKEGQYCHRYGPGSRSILIVECTKAQEIQIRIEFEFYRDLLKEEQELLFEAFIQKHRIFGNSGEEPEPPDTGRNGTVGENVGNDGGPSGEELYTIIRKQIGGNGHETRYKSEDHALRGI